MERDLGELSHESNYLNRLMRLIYYSACKVKYGDAPVPAMLIEGCAIVHQGKGLIFTGLQKEARTVLAGMYCATTDTVLTDENILVSRYENGTVSLVNAPIINDVPMNRTAAIPVGGLFFLKQGEHNSSRRLEAAEACVRLIRQIPNPAYIGQNSKREIYGIMADFSTDIAEHIPVREIVFTPDQDGWLNISNNIDNIVLEKEMVI